LTGHCDGKDRSWSIQKSIVVSSTTEDLQACVAEAVDQTHSQKDDWELRGISQS